MWEAIRYAGTPLTIIAFIVAVSATIYRQYLRRRLELIKSVPEDRRAALVDKELETYSITQDNLTREQKFQLMKEVLHRRDLRFKTTALVAFGIAVLLTVVVLVAILAFRPIPAPNGRADDAVNLVRIVNDKNEELTSRALALKKLAETQDVKARNIFEMAKALFPDALHTDQKKREIALGIIQDACKQGVVVEMGFVCQEYKEIMWHRKNYAGYLRALSLESDSAKRIDLNVQAKNWNIPDWEWKISGTFWFSLFQSVFKDVDWNLLKSLNEQDFLIDYIQTLYRLTANLEAQRYREMISHPFIGIRILGAAHTLSEPELLEDQNIHRLAIAIIVATLEPSEKSERSLKLAASTFEILKSADIHDPDILECVWRIIIDEDDFNRRSTFRPGEEHKRGIIDRFYNAEKMLIYMCKFEGMSSILEARLIQFIIAYRTNIARLTANDLDYSNGDDRIRACLRAIFSMNVAMYGIEERKRVERRLSPEVISAVNKLFSIDEQILVRLNLDHEHDSWKQIKAGTSSGEN